METMMLKPFLTRTDAVRFIRETKGIPVTLSTLHKAASAGTGPVPAARYGGRHFLYTEDAVMAWAETLVTPLAEQSAT
jgi:hypothetical protein